MRSIIIIFLLSILVACAPGTPLATASASLTPSQTPQPTKTFVELDTPTIFPSDTPVPCLKVNSDKSEYEWCPENVLILFDTSPGDGGRGISAPSPPNLVLYADGSLFLLHSEKTDDGYDTKILFKKLDRKEICQHLNTFEQIGYFDYDPLSYEFIGGRPAVLGAYGSMTLEINAWQSKRDVYYELGFFLDDELTGEFAKETQKLGVDPAKREGWPVISPELRNVYYFLHEYPVVNFEVYQPERLGVWMLPIEQKYLNAYTHYDEPRMWTVTKPSLADLSKRIDLSGKSTTNYAILSGDEVEVVYEFFGQSYAVDLLYEKDINGDNEYYLLLERPLLPYELPDFYFTQIPAPDTPKPNFNLTCYLEDGVLPIPTPSMP